MDAATPDALGGKDRAGHGALVNAILASRRHLEQGYRSCLGIMRLGERYGDDRLEAACHRALAIKALSYRSVESILAHGLDANGHPRTTRTPPAARQPARAEYFH